MRAGANVAPRLALDRRIVEQPHHRIAVADRVDEIILVDLQVAGDRAQDLEAGAVEGRVQFLERGAKARYFFRPDIVRHVGAELVAFGQVSIPNGV